MRPSNKDAAATEGCGVESDIMVYLVQYIWEIGRRTGVRGDTFQLYGKTHGPIRKLLAAYLPEHQRVEEGLSPAGKDTET